MAWKFGRSAWNHEALVSSWRGRGPRPPASFAEAHPFAGAMGFPAGASGSVPPEPPSHNKACTPPLFPEGLETTRNPSVTGGNSLRIGVRSKGQAVPWPSGPDVTLGTIRRWDLRGGAGAKASRLHRGFSARSRIPVLPADASGAYRPNPRHNKLVPSPRH